MQVASERHIGRVRHCRAAYHLPNQEVDTISVKALHPVSREGIQPCQTGKPPAVFTKRRVESPVKRCRISGGEVGKLVPYVGGRNEVEHHRGEPENILRTVWFVLIRLSVSRDTLRIKASHVLKGGSIMTCNHGRPPRPVFRASKVHFREKESISLRT